MLIGFTVLALFLLILHVVPVAAATVAAPAPEIAVRLKVDGIDRFAWIDTDVYRGSSPTESGLRSLARAHVKTLICLRRKVPYREAAEELGFRIEHIPLSQFEAPSRESILRFLDITTDPSARPVFFHCRYGESRTGAMAALYRMQVQGWPKDVVLAEMKEFGFDRMLFDLKGFVGSHQEAQIETPSGSIDKEAQAQVEAGNQLLEKEQVEEAILHYQAALQRYQGFTEARLGLAQAFLKTGNMLQALSEVRRAMISAGSREERIKVARLTIKILAEASARGELPSYGFVR